jgi:hypothetical protein
MKELIKIQSELKAPKNQTNAFGKYKYRSCEDILEALKPILLKHDCYLTITDSIFEINGVLAVNATASITNNEGLKVEVTAQAGIDIHRKGMDIAQCFGSSSSYARKYALNGLFLIDDTKDADATNQGDTSYLDDWKAQLAQIKSIDDLQALYDKNKPTDKQIISLFTKRKIELGVN